MLVKVKFLRNGEEAGRPYTYLTTLPLQAGDRVIAGRSEARVVEVDVPAEEVAAFADRLKRIDIQFLDDQKETPAEGLETAGVKTDFPGAAKEPARPPIFAAAAGKEDFFG